MVDTRIAVVGAGANGAAIGADLTRAGFDVTFIEQWPAHVETMRAKGVRVEMPEETLTTLVRVFHLCEVATLREEFDIVLIAVKAYDTRWACELIKPLVSPKGTRSRYPKRNDHRCHGFNRGARAHCGRCDRNSCQHV